MTPGAVSCHPCPMGTYQAQVGQSVCNFCNLHCPAGKYHTGCGGGSKGACVACAAGKHKEHAGWHSCSTVLLVAIMPECRREVQGLRLRPI